MHRPQRRDSDMCSMCPRDSFVDISMNKLSQTHLPNDGVGDPRPHRSANVSVKVYSWKCPQTSRVGTCCTCRCLCAAAGAFSLFPLLSASFEFVRASELL
eukprot:Tamp_22844.p4 GENE.Tamp_22844~~Tamp_22844.p4  ORF type:complete len:100 (-),score=3.05 Tamp_22844:353-652(-)